MRMGPECITTMYSEENTKIQIGITVRYIHNMYIYLPTYYKYYNFIVVFLASINCKTKYRPILKKKLGTHVSFKYGLPIHI